MSSISLKAQGGNSFSELPLQLSVSKGSNETLVIYLSGDGGWNEFNQQMVKQFENKGYGVVALNTRKYFWSEKSPDEFARDIEQISNYYLKEWNKSSLNLVGYSFGADVASFLPGRLSFDLQKKIKKIALLSPSASTDFVIRLGDMIGGNENVNRKYKVGPEISKIGLPLVCVFGLEEVMALKSALSRTKAHLIYELPGDHQYNQDFDLVLKTIGM
ncbi:MAG TPA: alpha/beta fold hydrolase [Prolixibacteraceae bacterium]